MQTISYRPLPTWPHEPTKPRRHSQFKSGWPRTLGLLMREVATLGGRDITLGMGLEDRDIRLDGLPRADAREPLHPGVEISFDSRDHGRLAYSTDAFHDWKDNVRAIALSLEALRAVERYGASKGRQYTGFALLTAGPGLEELGRKHAERWGSITEALRHTHPDTGDTDMTPHDYQAVMAYRAQQKRVSP